MVLGEKAWWFLLVGLGCSFSIFLFSNVSNIFESLEGKPPQSFLSAQNPN